MTRKSNLIKREKKMTVYVFPNATSDELKEVETLKKLGWIIKPATEKKEEKKKVTDVEITEDFNIKFDEATKEQMIDFIKKFKSAEDLKMFAVASHKNKDGEVVKNKDGKPRYFHLNAKRYFYETFFSQRWVEIKKMLDERGFKAGAKKKANALEEELLNLL
jgi:hypothetical protein